MALRRRTRRIAAVAAVAVVLAGGGGWWLFGRGGDAASATTRTATASLTTMQKTVQATGTLTPTVRQDVSFAVSGTVTSVDVAPGDTVVAGQRLATVDTLQLDADLLSARAGLALAQAEVSNLKGSAGSSTSDAQIAAASARVDVAAAAVTAAEEDVAAATLVAPVDGLVTTVDIATGDKVVGQASQPSVGGSAQSPGGTDTPIGSSAQLTIVGTDAYQVTVTVGAADLPNVAVGHQVEMTSTSLADTVFGVVASVSLVPSSASGTAAYPVVVTVTGDTSALHDGVSVTAQIVYERRTDVLTVPSAAVTTVDSTSSVLKVDADGTVTKTAVETGETSGQLTEIVAGLAEGDQVQLSAVDSQTRTRQDGSRDGFQIPDGGPVPGFPDGERPSFPDGFQMPGGGNR
ncbi:MAG: biotin/lipoyl-binding protein [Micrococcales bacterium]|nr:biotin/lipoyl-binding protein [Micrococcales bacterium]